MNFKMFSAAELITFSEKAPGADDDVTKSYHLQMQSLNEVINSYHALYLRNATL